MTAPALPRLLLLAAPTEAMVAAVRVRFPRDYWADPQEWTHIVAAMLAAAPAVSRDTLAKALHDHCMSAPDFVCDCGADISELRPKAGKQPPFASIQDAWAEHTADALLAALAAPEDRT